MSKGFSGLSAGRPSQTAAAKARLMDSLKDDGSAEPMRRVNFQVPESKHRKLKVLAAQSNQSIKEFLTAYIDSLPNE